ncbi:hypothetical protein HanPI659440_Chr06g0247071 [Helianthus annuus]|nr:hypothetical protein HanPI659440_Chr06g0247071 [Helianthus annuus]
MAARSDGHPIGWPLDAREKRRLSDRMVIRSDCHSSVSLYRRKYKCGCPIGW